MQPVGSFMQLCRSALSQHLALGSGNGLTRAQAAWAIRSHAHGSDTLRGIMCSALSAMPGLFVPPMGDSITEGTVAAVLVKPGDTVTEDQTVAQIETDKVTIDVKASEAGVIQELLVSVGTVVNPGSMVASVSATAVPEFRSSMLPPDVPGVPLTKPTNEKLPVEPRGAAADGHHAHKVSITFPPRLTTTGQRISDLPADQAEAATPTKAEAPASLNMDKAASAATPPARPTPSPIPSMQRKAVASEKMAEMPRRREMTQKEMDLVNLGGAV